MVNVNKLKGRIVEQGLNMEELANRSGIEKTKLYRRMKNPSGFTIEETEKLSEALELDNELIVNIFFA